MTLRLGLMGVLAGLAILTKGTNWSLLPLLAGAWLFAVIRFRPTAQRALASGAAAAVGLAIMVGPEIAYNMATYGLPSPMQEAIVNHQHGRGLGTLLHAAAIFPWMALTCWMWLQGVLIRGGWSLIEPSSGLIRVYYWAVVAAALGWAAMLIRLGMRATSVIPKRFRRLGASEPGAVFDSPWTPAACVLFCASVTGALGYHAIQSMLAWGNSTTGAWYAAAAFPWFQILAVRGALAWPSFLGRATAAVLVGSYVVGEQAMIWTKMLPTYSGGARGLEALGRIAQLQPAVLSTATCLTALTGAALLLIGIAASLARLSRAQTASHIVSTVPGPYGNRRRQSVQLPITSSVHRTG
jgi:hypothetical protein